MSDLKSRWFKGSLEGLGPFFIAAPIWVPLAEGEGLQWPSADDAFMYICGAIGGIALLWWASRIKISDEDE